MLSLPLMVLPMFINCLIGVKQGDLLGLILFTIYIAAIMMVNRGEPAFNDSDVFFYTKEDLWK